MIALIDGARKDGDSLGGVVEAVARGVPAGPGRAGLRQAGGRPGQGDAVAAGLQGLRERQRLRRHPPARLASTTTPSTTRPGSIRTRTNRSGGIQGGISNGEDIVIRVAFKPTATILREQQTVDVEGNETTLKPRGRHDPCVLPRAVPMVEAMMALVLADHFLRQRGQCGPRLISSSDVQPDATGGQPLDRRAARTIARPSPRRATTARSGRAGRCGPGLAVRGRRGGRAGSPRDPAPEACGRLPAARCPRRAGRTRRLALQRAGARADEDLEDDQRRGRHARQADDAACSPSAGRQGRPARADVDAVEQEPGAQLRPAPRR